MVGRVIEMFKFQVSSSLSKYDISIFNEEFDVKNQDIHFLLADKYFQDYKKLDSNSIFISAEEKKKNLGTCSDIIEKLADLGANRKSILGVLGGGLVQDLGTIVSSLYMRGLQWKFFPTTLMAMTDSCIGGKSSINSNHTKNLIGNFYPPTEVIIYTKFIDSLNNIQIACGLLEAIKICYAAGSEVFNEFLKILDICLRNNFMSSADSAELIYITLHAKKLFVELDEFDSGIRQHLNFGHTFGHAIETATSFIIPHGIAIGIGMLAALHFKAKPLTPIENELKEGILRIIDLTHYLIPYFPYFDDKKFIEAFRSDKKHEADLYHLIISEGNSLEKKAYVKNEMTEKRILESTKEVILEVYS